MWFVAVIGLLLASNLYVLNHEGPRADSFQSNVAVYAPGTATPVRTIAGLGFDDAQSFAFDAAANLYVAIQSANAIRVYAPGTTSPLRSISKGVYGAGLLAFDRTGDLWVGDRATGGCSQQQCPANIVTIIAPASSTVLRHVRAYDPKAFAFDAVGNAYVACVEPALLAPAIKVYAPASGEPIQTIVAGITDPRALAFDAAGNLYTLNAGDDGDIVVYAPGKTSPLRTIRSGVHHPVAMAFDRRGALYVANHGANDVAVYAPGMTSVKRTISSGVNVPLALAFDPAGNLYVINGGWDDGGKGHGSIAVYAPGATAPMRVITEGLYNPRALAFGP